MKRYDIAVIGSGPAGLEAAITAKIRNKEVLLLGSNNLSTKIEKAHTIKNYLGLPEISGEDMKEQFQNHLNALDLSIKVDRVNAVYAMGDYFALQGHSDMYEAKSVILACGMAFEKNFPGELENLGKGVSYCATCDATLYRGKKTVVIGYSKEEEKEADFLAEMAEEVVYLPMYEEETSLNEKVKVMKGVKPVSVRNENGKILLDYVMKNLQTGTADNNGIKRKNAEIRHSEAENGKSKSTETEAVNKETKKSAMEQMETETIETDGLFILRESVAPSQLVPGLQIENNHVAVDRELKTNIPGLFACGDVTGTPYQYIKAAGEGNVAALSAVNYLLNAK